MKILLVSVVLLSLLLGGRNLVLRRQMDAAARRRLHVNSLLFWTTTVGIAALLMGLPRRWPMPLLWVLVLALLAGRSITAASGSK